ncbi:hypothetical protein ALC62_10197, partial [Cyphomyrmex costatus]
LRRKAAGFNKSLASAATKGCHRKFLCLEDRAGRVGSRRVVARNATFRAGRQLPCHVLDAGATATRLQHVTTIYTPYIARCLVLIHKYSSHLAATWTRKSENKIILEQIKLRIHRHLPTRRTALYLLAGVSYCQFYQWHKACNYAYFPNFADLRKPECIECLHRYPTPIMRNSTSSIYNIHSPMRRTLPYVLRHPTYHQKVGRVYINNNRKLVESYFIAFSHVKTVVRIMIGMCSRTLWNIPIFAAPPQWHPHCTMAPTCQRLLMSVAATAMCGIALGLPSLELQTNAITLLPYTGYRVHVSLVNGKLARSIDQWNEAVVLADSTP